ncbi:hypothetical protein [Succinimonas amylolytica]|uniref:hypothetical protein n=1 Tax=Succinimonas amylolytica TaxID=83769 RepID=UPI003CCBAF06
MSKYDVSWTGQFNKDYRLARKRNLNIELLDEIENYLEAKNFPKRTEITHYQETGRVIVNVIFSRTGF